MAKIAPRNKIQDKIENRTITQSHREYLGVSQIGKECKRQLWYQFRCYLDRDITPRQNRLFARGHNEEPIIIKDLKDIGVDILSYQEEAITGHGHIKGHSDGRLANVPGYKKVEVLLEAKTANDANFKKVKRLGVEKWNPSYYIQAQCYMYLFDLPVCLFIVVNKNDDYRHYEFIKVDRSFADSKICDAINYVLFASTPPPRVSEDNEFYLCNWCDYSEICHGNSKTFNKNCRTCKFSAPASDGKWGCIKGKNKKSPKKLSWPKKQLKGCKKHKSII